MSGAELKCLLVDNDPFWQSQYNTLIAEGWQREFPFVSVEVVVASGLDQAIHLITEHPDDFDLGVVDILLDDDDEEPLGLAVIRKLREHNEGPSEHKTAIIGISFDSDWVNKAEAAGAHEWVGKGWLMDQPLGSADFGMKMRGAFEKAGIDPLRADGIKASWSEDDLSLAATVHTIGEATLLKLALRLLREKIERVEISPVRAGLSGASVLRMRCSIPRGTDKGPRQRDLLVKVSRDPLALRREREVAQLTQDFPGGLFQSYDLGVESSSGWQAIGCHFRGGPTLIDWLAGSPSPDLVEHCLESLFLGGSGLQRAYSDSMDTETTDRFPAALHQLLLTDARRAHIELAARELASVVGRHASDANDRLAVVETFVRARRFGNVDVPGTRPEACLVRSHGDLHGRNALVEGRNRPVLIDPANIGMLPWTSDWARLSVDLLTSMPIVGDSAFEWDDLGMWRADVNGFVRGDRDVNSASLSFSTALAWLRSNVYALCPFPTSRADQEWKLRLALAVELSRGSYRVQELPPPRRVLALLAAADAFDAAAEAFTSRSIAPGS
jgi:CheY-like chemotaxis protein